MLLPTFTGACSTMQLPPPVAPLQIQRVEIPGPPIACKPDLGPEPKYFTPTEYSQAPDIVTIIQMFVTDRKLFIARMAEKDAALRSCAGQ
jgi:hypothetical protein